MTDDGSKLKCPVDGCNWHGLKSAAVAGVCPKCAKRFRKKHIAHFEAPDAETHATTTPEILPDNTAYVLNHLEPTDDFNWNLVDSQDRESVQSEIKRQSALSVAKFSRRLLELGGRNRNQFFIAANCFAFAAHIHPDQQKSGEEIAKKLHVGKAAFFKRVNTIRDILKLPRIAGARSDAARKTFKRTAKKHHEKNKRTYQTKPTGNFIDRLNDAH